MYEQVPEIRRCVLNGTDHLHIGKIPYALRPEVENLDHMWRFVTNFWGFVTIPRLLDSYSSWIAQTVDPRTTSLELTVDLGEAERIGGSIRERMSDLIKGAPLVLIFFGEITTLVMRHSNGKVVHEVRIADESVCILPYETCEKWAYGLREDERGRGTMCLALRAFSFAIAPTIHGEMAP